LKKLPASSGIKSGDVIKEVNLLPVEDLRKYNDMIGKAENGSPFFS